MKLPDLERSYEHLTYLGQSPLTRREIDIIACIMRGRTSKKSIALVLSISYRTVETHIRNILNKINATSWEFIREKVESLNLAALFYRHYNILLFEQGLLKLLQEPFVQNSAMKVYFLITDDSLESPSELKSMLEYLRSNRLNIKIESISLSALQTKVAHSNVDPEYTILIAETSSLSFLTNLRSFVNVFAYNEDSDAYDFMLFLLDGVITDKTKLDNLRTLLGKTRQSILQNESSVVEESNFSSPRFKPKQTILIYNICILFCVLITILVKHYFFSAEPLRVATILPPENQCLKRTETLEAINNVLNKPRNDNYINIVTIVGDGGAGKTILARMVTKKQKGVVWEIQASNQTELTCAFTDLAFHLVKDSTDRERLSFIVENSPLAERNNLILNFVRDKLKRENKWTLLFDNVTSYEDIEKHLPKYQDDWGNGRVIITTRNGLLNVGDHVYLDELSYKEAQELLRQILSSDQQNNTLDLDRLLKYIAHFPLDLVTAGLYIKHTGISINEYLERLNHQDSSKAQVNLLKQTFGYKNTRKDIGLVCG